MSKELYTHMVPTPNRLSMNSGLSPARVSTLESIFGEFPNLPVNCGDCQNPRVSRHLETRDVGPFRCTAITPFLDALERVFAKVKSAHPELDGLLGTEGAMCYRRVRGSSSPSNHSSGTAIDLSVGGVTPDMDYSPETPEMIPNGFVILYGYMHREKIYWAAGYAGGRVDSMHFEASDELLHEWHAKDLI